MPETSERSFEDHIENMLVGLPASAGRAGEPVAGFGEFLPGGYVRRTTEDYDRELCLDSGMAVSFVIGTQPKEWDDFAKRVGKDARSQFLSALADKVTKFGLLRILRSGLGVAGSRFKLAYFLPSSGLNPDVVTRYQGNVFSVVRQLHFSAGDEKSLDMVLFMNGLPIFTAELKNPLTGQSVQDAIKQYCLTRDPREPLFRFGRCLAHFAVDPDLVYMTSHLQGEKTRFLPFNQGYNGGAGNPPSATSYAAAYLWEHVWTKDSVLSLIRDFVQEVEEEDDDGRRTGRKFLIFPRYHQLDCVRRLIADAQRKGAGQRYLIQHSAGSGKSYSISWLAHQLSVLHDRRDERVFNSVIVISDRRVIDRQLQAAVRQFEQTPGVVENIDKTSRQLKDALELGKNIIVSTLQKFPVIAEQMGTLPGKRFAVIIDEAHSSQTGESIRSLKEVLAVESLQEADRLEGGELEDDQDRLLEQMRTRGRLPNVSYFAFTATPKNKTLEMFGTQLDDGRFEPFSLYSMRQAIEEKFILDVLENYTTFQEYWNLLKRVQDDPRYDKAKAQYLLRQFVAVHEHTVGKKVAIIVEHFRDRVAGRINGKAKAMIVCRSRLHAVRYYLALKRYLAEQNLPFKALIAFSGTVQDGGKDYTEANMNGIPEAQTAATFKQPEQRFLVVANKFQTGFDQPLLHTMYVDRRLSGLHAVQTLSRLNRRSPAKEETMVLDFANDADTIQKSFQPYYDKTILERPTDPNILYDRQTELEDFQVFTNEEVEGFARVYFDPRGTHERLHAEFQPAVERFKALKEEEQLDFYRVLVDFVRLYAFLSQVIQFTDARLERLYLFCRLLRRRLPVSRKTLPYEIQTQVDMESYQVTKTSEGKIKLKRGNGSLSPVTGGVIVTIADETEALSLIIRELNKRFGTSFSEEDKVFIQQLEDALFTNEALKASARVNTPENVRMTFNHVVTDRLQDMIDSNFKFYKQMTDNEDFAQFVLEALFKRYLSRAKTES